MAKTFRGIKNIFLILTGFLTCPCHLPFLLPALAGLLAGTAVGAFIDTHTGLLTALATIYFVSIVVYFLSRDKRGESQRSSQATERSREYVEER
jgi:MerE protein